MRLAYLTTAEQQEMLSPQQFPTLHGQVHPERKDNRTTAGPAKAAGSRRKCRILALALAPDFWKLVAPLRL
jgi:hypothetical protein